MISTDESCKRFHFGGLEAVRKLQNTSGNILIDFFKYYVSSSATQGNLGSSNAMVLEESIVEGNDNGDSEIVHSNDDFEMLHPSPVQSASMSRPNRGPLLRNIMRHSYKSIKAVFFVLCPSSVLRFGSWIFFSLQVKKRTETLAVGPRFYRL
jgi:hypothetical protein